MSGTGPTRALGSLSTRPLPGVDAGISNGVGGFYGERGARIYTGVWGCAPRDVLRQAPGRGLGGSPPEDDEISAIKTDNEQHIL